MNEDRNGHSTAVGHPENSQATSQPASSQPASSQPEDSQSANSQPEDSQSEDSQPDLQRRRAAVSSGNPRINVAFPFARIAVQEPSEALCELAGLVEDLAELLVTLTRGQAAGQPEAGAGAGLGKAADRLAAEAAVLARRLGSG